MYAYKPSVTQFYHDQNSNALTVCVNIGKPFFVCNLCIMHTLLVGPRNFCASVCVLCWGWLYVLPPDSFDSPAWFHILIKWTGVCPSNQANNVLKLLPQFIVLYRMKVRSLGALGAGKHILCQQNIRIRCTHLYSFISLTSSHALTEN